MIDKLFNIIKISFPIISIMGFVKISVFYSQFGINVLYYFDLIDYFTLLRPPRKSDMITKKFL